MTSLVSVFEVALTGVMYMLCVVPSTPHTMNNDTNSTNGGTPATYTKAADFKAALKDAKRHAPGTWEQLATLLIKAGHANALADVLPLLPRDSGRRIVRPNNAREVERLMKYVGRMGADNKPTA